MTIKLNQFMLNPLWEKARWSATTFRWHIRNEAPPIIGLVFDDAIAGRDLFSTWNDKYSNTDTFEDIRVAIVEGEIEGFRPGYSIHLAADIESILAKASAEGIVVADTLIPMASRVNRMHPVPGSPPMLAHFKEKFIEHQEYLIAPVTRRGDGQLWIDVELGIVKHKIHFRHVSEITDNDVDSIVKLANLIRFC